MGRVQRGSEGRAALRPVIRCWSPRYSPPTGVDGEYRYRIREFTRPVDHDRPAETVAKNETIRTEQLPGRTRRCSPALDRLPSLGRGVAGTARDRRPDAASDNTWGGGCSHSGGTGRLSSGESGTATTVASNTAPMTITAQATTSTQAAAWKPCDIPDSDIAAVGLNPSTKNKTDPKG